MLMSLLRVPNTWEQTRGGLMPTNFNASAGATLGVEVEFGIVDRETWALSNSASDLLADLDLARPEFQIPGSPHAKHELYESQLEVVTGICDTAGQAHDELALVLNAVQTLAQAHDLALFCAGTHPFSHASDQRVSPDPRYHKLLDNLPQAREFLIFGIHYHLGVESGPRAIQLVNALSHYLPHLLALSASSPFVDGRDSGMASRRSKIFETLPRTGVPPQWDDWQHFSDVYDILTSTRRVQSVRDLWWDVRPHPDFGTVEIRICDGMNSLEDIAACAALAHSLVTMLNAKLDDKWLLPPLDRVLLQENKDEAGTKGMEADIHWWDNGRIFVQSIKGAIDDLLVELEPFANTIGCAEQFAHLGSILNHGPSYIRQRELVAQGASPEELVAFLASQLHAYPQNNDQYTPDTSIISS